MAKNRYDQKPGDGYWKGTCLKCHTDVTKRTSLAVPDGKDVKRIEGGKLPRFCRDSAACKGRIKQQGKENNKDAEAPVVS